MVAKKKDNDVITPIDEVKTEGIIEITSTVDDQITENTVSESKPIVEEKIKWEPDLHRMICVKNISRGKLVYVSKRQNGFETIWENTNDEDYLELQELVSLKNSYKRFVTEPWIRINEPDEVEILKYLQVYKYYEKILDVDIDNMLMNSPDKFEKKFKTLPNSFKQAIAGRAAEMMKSGELDSLKIKSIIEKEMDIDLSLYARG